FIYQGPSADEGSLAQAIDRELIPTLEGSQPGGWSRYCRGPLWEETILPRLSKQGLMLEPAASLAAESEHLTLLNLLARLYVLGVEIDWQALNPGPHRQVPLPTYPFERKRFAIFKPEAPTKQSAVDATPDSTLATSVPQSLRLGDWFHQIQWQPVE